jgi:hypothetical protein
MTPVLLYLITSHGISNTAPQATLLTPFVLLLLWLLLSPLLPARAALLPCRHL